MRRRTRANFERLQQPADLVHETFIGLWKKYIFTSGLTFWLNFLAKSLTKPDSRQYICSDLTKKLNPMDNSNTPEKTPDSTEQRIFDAAHELFVLKGMDGAKMQEIADRAGINKALLHYYYRSKEKLYEMVAKVVISRAIPIIRNLLESEEPLEEKISRFIDFYIDLVSRNPFIPLFVINELNKHPERFYENILPKELPRPETFFRQVEEAVAKGELKPVKPQHLIVNIVAMCIFPFVAKPMIRIVLGMNPDEINAFLAERKETVKSFVFQAIKP